MTIGAVHSESQWNSPTLVAGLKPSFPKTFEHALLLPVLEAIMHRACGSKVLGQGLPLDSRSQDK
jgi:hypothetical protein